jgi:GntR family negative regulator for fad regulon and positive regulator of fabA
MQWEIPEKPAEVAEQRIINAIVEGVFPINSSLPSERDLSTMIGVTRPTLREALQRLSRDGWIEIHQGKTTRVRNYWTEGNLNVLSSISKYSDHLPEDFVVNLMQIRFLLCPTYTFMAAKNNPKEIISFLERAPQLHDDPKIFSEFDFLLHQKLTQISGNPIFTLILNGFKELFTQKAVIYFQNENARAHSISFYHDLKIALLNNQPQVALEITEKIMDESILLWKTTT